MADLGRARDQPDLLALAEELVDFGVWELDLRTGMTRWSDGMFRIRGMDPDAAVPSMELVLEQTHPGDRDRMSGLLRGAWAHPERVPAEGIVAEYRILLPDATVRELRFHGRVVRDDDGTPVRWIGVTQDITDLRLSEREAEVRYAVTRALRDWGTFDEGMVGLLRRLATALDCPIASLWTWDEHKERLVARALWWTPSLEGRVDAVLSDLDVRPGEGIAGMAWEAKGPVALAGLDVGSPSPERRALAERLGLRSAVAFPAMTADGPLAALAFYSTERRELGAPLMCSLADIGHELGHFLSTRRAELGPQPLTERELEILTLAAAGKTGPLIAAELVVSPSTVKSHFEHIYEKLGVGGRAAAVAYALRLGLIR